MKIAHWTLSNDVQINNHNLGIIKTLQLSIDLDKLMIAVIEQLLQEYNNVFAWTYKDFKGIPPYIAQHRIELDTTIPLTHQAKY